MDEGPRRKATTTTRILLSPPRSATALRRVKDRLEKFNVASAEVGHQDLWQRATLGIVAISTATEHVEQSLAAAVDEIDRVEPGLVTRTEIEFLM